MMDTLIKKLSSTKDVCDMYDESAQWYAQMMDSEIQLPVYSETLSRLQEKITDIDGYLVDTACGSGHMLGMYHDQYEPERPLIGIDLSPRMVAITQQRLGNSAQAIQSDMCKLTTIKDKSSAALINFFAIHHIGPDELQSALLEWNRVLKPGGHLFIAAWEGEGVIDYGDHSDIVAIRYRADELRSAVRDAGFSISRCVVEPVEGFPMDAIYLEGEKD